MKQLKIKGSFSDLKPALNGLKMLMESTEQMPKGKKPDMYDLQEIDLANIKRHGESNG